MRSPATAKLHMSAKSGSIYIDDGRADLPVPQEVRDLVGVLENAGFSAWTVGGGVRDALRGERPQDWDVATSARPPDVRRLFRRTVAIGIEHGTIGVIGKSGRMYEVTTFRRDVETFGRKARVVFAETLEEDLARRDFTMNAVAWHPESHELRDPHQGVSDLQNRVLRTVGEPAERFREDRLRVLRGLRFAGRFQLRIDPATWEAAVDSAPELHILSAERVREELWKVLGGQESPSTAVRLYGEAGVLRELYPELEVLRSDPSPAGPWEHTLRCVDAAPQVRVPVRVAALLHRCGIAAESNTGEAALRSAAVARDLLRRLKCSNADVDTVTHLIAQLPAIPSSMAADAEFRRWIRVVGVAYTGDLFKLARAACEADGQARGCADGLAETEARAAAVLASNPALGVGDLMIGGNDLRDAGIPAGRRYSTILSELLELVTDDPSMNERERLLGEVERIEARQRSENAG